MARVRKRKAAELLGSLSDALSDDLLGDEEEARANMEAVFIGAISPVAEALERLQTESDVDDVVDLVTRSAEQVALATAGPFRVLTERAVAKGLSSITAELQVVESTLGTRYAGLADAAVLRVSRNVDVLLDFTAGTYLTALQPTMSWWRTQLDLELRVAVADRESSREVLIRLISPAPVRLREHSGRGLWWKVLEACNRVTRECEIGAVNSARTEAMVQFNAIGEERG